MQKTYPKLPATLKETSNNTILPLDHILLGFCSGGSGEGRVFSSPPALGLHCTLSSCMQPSFQAVFGAEKNP